LAFSKVALKVTRRYSPRYQSSCGGRQGDRRRANCASSAAIKPSFQALR
jgi:hypothetical protein